MRMQVAGVRGELFPNTAVPSKFVPRHIGSEEQILITKQKSQSGLTVAEKAVLNAINKVNKTLEGTPQRFEFKVHQKSGSMIVKIYNKETDELIREIPPEKIVELVQRLQEIVVGSIIDEKR